MKQFKSLLDKTAGSIQMLVVIQQYLDRKAKAFESLQNCNYRKLKNNEKKNLHFQHDFCLYINQK